MRISDWSSDVCSSDLHMYGNADACLTCCALTDAKIIHMILLISQHVLRPIKTTRYGPKCLCKACLQAGACAVHGSQICGGIFGSIDASGPFTALGATNCPSSQIGRPAILCSAAKYRHYKIGRAHV